MGYNMKKLFILLLLTSCSSTNELYRMNKQINSYKYIPDKENYMKTPTQFYTDGGGDCEDFANAKYEMLEKMGYKDINFVWDIPNKHMMVEGAGYVLDNRTDAITPSFMVKGIRLDYKNAQEIGKIPNVQK